MNLRGLQRHAAASYRWLHPRLGENGRWRNNSDLYVDTYHKAPWCFTSMGDHEAAQRSLAYIERNHLRADGDLEPVNGRNLRERYPLYPHAHVALGAVLADRADVTDRILEFLSRHRHPELGAWGDREDGRQRRRFDAISTSSVALAFLERGRLEEAHAAARFLENMLDIQPNFETEFLTTVFGSGDLVTEFPDALVATDRRVKLGARFQVWHAIGFPLAFLARLLEVSGDEHWLHVANRYLSLLDRSAQSWTDLSTGKSAWGCAVLYRVTGEPGYRERALRAMRALVALQAGDGGWLPCLDGDGGTSDAPTSIGYDVIVELAQWLALIGETVAQRDGIAWTPPARSGDEKPFDRWNRQTERIALQLMRRAAYRWQRTQQTVSGRLLGHE